MVQVSTRRHRRSCPDDDELVAHATAEAVASATAKREVCKSDTEYMSGCAPKKNSYVGCEIIIITITPKSMPPTSNEHAKPTA